MSADVRTACDRDVLEADRALASGTPSRLPASPPLAADSLLAVEIRGYLERGELEAARQRFGGLVELHQRRAVRIAYQYLRDSADADEVVQDSFVKAFSHLGSYREAWPFEVWFTRILINGCLDRRKARTRRGRWFTGGEITATDEARLSLSGGPDATPEGQLLARERRARVVAAVNRLEGRQRTVFMLCHFGDCTPREVSVMTGLNESTVRVHLFRAARKLRALLGAKS